VRGPQPGISRLGQRQQALWDSPTIMVGGRESYEARCVIAIEFPEDEDQNRASLKEPGAGSQVFDCNPGSWLPAPDSVLNVRPYRQHRIGQVDVVELLKEMGDHGVDATRCRDAHAPGSAVLRRSRGVWRRVVSGTGPSIAPDAGQGQSATKPPSRPQRDVHPAVQPAPARLQRAAGERGMLSS